MAGSDHAKALVILYGSIARMPPQFGVHVWIMESSITKCSQQLKLERVKLNELLLESSLS